MKRFISLIWIVFLAFIVMGKTLFEGGILNLLDYIFVPNPPFFWYRPFVEWGLFSMNALFGSHIASLGFFLGILLLAGFLGRAFAQMISEKFSYENLALLEMLSVSYFMLNPFMYERMMTQPHIAFGVVCLGFGVYFLLRTIDHNLQKNLLLSGLAFGLAWSAFPHASYMIAVIYGLFIFVRIRSLSDFLSLLSAIGIVFLLNLNWLVAPFLQTSGNVVASVSTFSDDNLLAFLTRATTPLNIEFTNLLLYGFWGENMHFAIPSALSPYWYIFGAVLFLFSCFGIFLLFREKNKKMTRVGIWLLALAGIAFILGLGIATSWSRPISEWMYEYAPLFRGYREPQKWIGLLMIIEGIGFVLASGLLLSWIRDRFFRIIFVLLLLVSLFLWSPGMLFSFRGQISTMNYPENFSSLRSALIENNSARKILILPWHSYMGCDWTNKRVIANPMASFFFPISALSADNIEMGALYSNSVSPESKVVEDFLTSSGHTITPILELGFTHIFVMKNCANLETFPWLQEISACHLVDEKPEYFLYQCAQ